MVVIGITGPKAAGKETVAKYIANKYSGKVHGYSEILDEILAILSIPNTRDNEIKLVALRKNFGPDVLNRALNKKINAENKNVEVITGVRFEEELNNLRVFPASKLIYIDAPIEKRYEWQHRRRQKFDDGNISFDEFVELESRETEVNIAKLGEKADFKIENSGTVEELYKKLDDIMKQIL